MQIDANKMFGQFEHSGTTMSVVKWMDIGQVVFTEKYRTFSL